MRLLAVLGVIFPAVMCPADVSAQPPARPDDRLTAHAVHVSERPTIDGVLDEPMWRAIEPTRAFEQRLPDEGAEPTERTEVRVAFDDRSLDRHRA